MKFIIPVIALLIGFGIGWHFSGKRIQENVKAALPAGMQESLDAIAEYLGPMSKEEVSEVMDQIRNFATQVVDEGHHQTFWAALHSNILKARLENDGKEAALEYANERIRFFREQYQEGMNLGEWQKVADSLYANTSDKGDQGAGLNSESLRSSP